MRRMAATAGEWCGVFDHRLRRLLAVRLLGVAAVVLALSLATSGRAPAADDLPIDAFFGTFTGQTEADPEQEVEKRELEVAIGPADRGFRLAWTTVIHKPDGRLKRNEQTVEFRRTERPGIYVSAVRKDMFGNKRPVDPLKGQSFIWATVRADTLFTYAMVISDQGTIELQVYERTLVDGGLDLRFYRFSEGWLRKTINTRLDRVDG